MRNRAGLLALVVLVVAILLMVFVVMPQIGEQKSGTEQAGVQAGSEPSKLPDAPSKPSGESAKTSRSSGGDTASGTGAGAVGDALGRLMQNASGSLDALNGLFTDGKGPSEDAFETAKTNAVTSLEALANFAVPPDANPADASAAGKAKDGAGKALAIIRALPENIADARAAIVRAQAALRGVTPAPDAALAAPAAPAGANPTATAAMSASAKPPSAQKIPSFDVLRVEPDGSAVIAGSATPNTQLDVMSGDTIVATTKVGPSGDFAAVLDTPLAPGDHQLALKSTDADGISSTSDEIATVSIPKDRKKSELLAMVSKPGTASRIISAPTATDQPTVAAADPSPSQPVSAVPDQVASAGTAASKPSAAQTAPTQTFADIMVSAVEIEGNKIFVAGRAKPNAKVQAFADDRLIGSAIAGPDGHFVVDGSIDLAVGDHKIRVDLIGPDGKASLRASVNFNRPAGTQVTVAAQGSQTGNETGVPLEQGRFNKLKQDVIKAFGLLDGLFADNKLPGLEQLAAARSGTEIALRSIVDFRPAVDAADGFKTSVSSARKTATDALALLRSLPGDPAAMKGSLGKLSALITQLSPSPADVSTMAASPAEIAADGSQPRTIEQAPLTQSKDTVIIRRGDTLWQISRRVYGAGVRYTTIYIANETQIRNPDRILPGQIFGLPKDALPNSEELHRKRLSHEQL